MKPVAHKPLTAPGNNNRNYLQRIATNGFGTGKVLHPIATGFMLSGSFNHGLDNPENNPLTQAHSNVNTLPHYWNRARSKPEINTVCFSKSEPPSRE